MLHEFQKDKYDVPGIRIWLGNTWTGDANFDGRVDISDLYILALHWEDTTTKGWLDGDFTENGVVDSDEYGDDLGVIALNWQCGVGGTVGISAETLAAMMGL